MREECRQLQDEIVAMRRDLHKIPEIGFDLPETSAYVKDKLEEFGIPYDFYEDINGIVGRIEGAGTIGHRHCVAFRADMDGLRIQEDTGLEFASVHEGKMHACGHDTHTAMLLGAAKVLSAHRDELNCDIRLIFQPYEEGVRGAKKMIEKGALEGVDEIYGIHIGTLMGMDIPSGKLVAVPGPIMASSDRFTITIHGKGCHAATPEKGIDPINIAAHIILGLQAIIAREFSAINNELISIGSINGGTQHNIIPDDVIITGTTRAYDEKTRARMEKRIGEVSKSMAEAFGGSVDYEYRWGCDPTVNDEEKTAFAATCIKKLLGNDGVVENAEPIMVAEDFSAYQKVVPGVLMHLSTADAKKGTACPHHNAHFMIDEDQLWKGTAAFVKIAEEISDRL